MNLKKIWKRAIKYPFDYPNSETNKKEKDTSKPKKFYVKLVTQKKKTGEFVCYTPIYDKNDLKINVFEFIDKPGKLKPAIYFEGLYYGPHGTISPAGISLKFKVYEGNWIPGNEKIIEPTGRLLPSNKPKVPITAKGKEKRYRY